MLDKPRIWSEDGRGLEISQVTSLFDRIAAPADPQLGIDLLDVPLDRVERQSLLHGDILVGFILFQVQKNGLFAAG